MKKNEYLFKSERLGFRNWRNEDLEEFAKLNADEGVMEHFPTIISKTEVEELIESFYEKWIHLLRNRNFRIKRVYWNDWACISRI